MVKIFIDPGHGGTDSGATANKLQEKNITLAIAKIIAKKLTAYENVTTKLSRTTDQTVSLASRTKMANDWHADFLLSIHINAGGGTGYEDYIFNGTTNKATSTLRNTIHTEITKHLSNIRNRGKKKANFHMLRESAMPAMLTENLFIDTKADANLLTSNDFLRKVAQAHTNGLIKAFGLKKKPSKTPTSDNNTFYRVIAGSYNDRINADNQVKKLKQLGIDDVFIDVYKQ